MSFGIGLAHDVVAVLDGRQSYALFENTDKIGTVGVAEARSDILDGLIGGMEKKLRSFDALFVGVYHGRHAHGAPKETDQMGDR